MKSLRVLMVARLFHPWVGGAEIQALKLAKKLAEQNISVEVVTGWWFRGTQQRETLEGIPVFRNHTMWEMYGIKGLRKFGGYLYILSLIWFLWRRRHQYDLIHVHGLNYHTFAAVLASRLLGRRTLAKLANSGPASDILKMRSDRQLALSRYMLGTALRCDRFVALTQTIVEELTAAGVPREKITELGNGVETDQIPAKSEYALHHLPRLIFVGRLHEQKGLDILLQAVQRLAAVSPPIGVCLQIVGDGPLLEALREQAARLNITDRVNFTGQVPHVIGCLQQADIFVLPSRAEGISNALLEAMACGLPVVVSNIPGNSHVIQHDQNGLLFKAEDADSLAQALTTLLQQPNLRKRLGRAARRTVEDHFSLNYVAGQYIEVYRDMLSEETHL
jgi:glycosyltransferase involved in cell wall biosynthesis